MGCLIQVSTEQCFLVWEVYQHPAPSTGILQAVSRRLAVLAAEVLGAKQRASLVTQEGMVQPLAPTPGTTGGVGSIEHTLAVRLWQGLGTAVG